MPLNMLVCVKQVVDPETPVSAFQIDAGAKNVVLASGNSPVINGFDENAVECALRIKDEVDGTVTILSLGNQFAMDVMKKPLAMGADELVLVEDPALENLDAYTTAYALRQAINKLGKFDLIFCGRQASDWDNAQVPQGLAELLGLPCITVAQKVEVRDSTAVIVERIVPDGYEIVESDLPVLVTVTNELGQPRYPTLRGIMAAGRKNPTVWTAGDVGISLSDLELRVRVIDLFIPTTHKQCDFIEGEDDADAGRRLALKLREEKLI